jgi:hypothetical protein
MAIKPNASCVVNVGFSSAEPKVPDDKHTGAALAMVIDPPSVDSGLWASVTNMYAEGPSHYS